MKRALLHIFVKIHTKILDINFNVADIYIKKILLKFRTWTSTVTVTYNVKSELIVG